MLPRSMSALARRLPPVASSVSKPARVGGAGVAAGWCMSRGFVAPAACASEPPPPPAKVTVALVQMKVGADKAANVASAREHIREAVKKGAGLVMLPEIWNGPYATKSFPEYCEAIPGVGERPDPQAHPTIAAIAEEAKANQVSVVAGSISERGADGKVYNTSVVLSKDGAVLGKHRKVHLFDIDIPGKMTFKESETLTGGSDVTTADVPVPGGMVRLGVGICYDLRFAELSLLMRNRGAQILCFPAAFNTTTGPLHWELVIRARAIDTQCFMCCCSPSRNPEGYPAYGHSIVVDPRGKVLAEAGHEPTILLVDVPVAEVTEARQQIPIGFQRRYDVYRFEEASKL